MFTQKKKDNESADELVKNEIKIKLAMAKKKLKSQTESIKLVYAVARARGKFINPGSINNQLLNEYNKEIIKYENQLKALTIDKARTPSS